MEHGETIASDRAVIYCRVSSPTQVSRGHGLDSQETRCREFAARNRYVVEDVFKDDMTGSLATRPGMQAMLADLDRNPGTRVLINDISRLARGLEAHLQLRAAMGGRGRCPRKPVHRVWRGFRLGPGRAPARVRLRAPAPEEQRAGQESHARPRHERLLGVSGDGRLQVREGAGARQAARPR
ncbi:MAG: recombinase family protein [Pseudomonadota bacterium]